MIDILVFSKNRAAQLQLLISSIERNFRGQFRVHILYKNDTQHQPSYDILFREYKQVNWIKQGDFHIDVFNFIHEHPLFMFLTDDCVIFREIYLDECAKKLTDEVWCISLRLGLNTTTQCYWTNEQQPQLIYEEDGDFIRWYWRRYNWAGTNWGYFSSLDGVIFNHKFLSVLPSNFNPRIPRELEGKLVNQEVANKIARYPYFVAPRHSACVCISNNAVQEGPPPNGLYHPYDADELNKQFLLGYRINYDKMNFNNIFSSHIELEFPLEKTNVLG